MAREPPQVHGMPSGQEPQAQPDGRGHGHGAHRQPLRLRSRQHRPDPRGMFEALNGIYCGPPPAPEGLWAAWNLDPALLAALAVLALVLGSSRPGAAAVAVLLVAFVSPLCALSSALFAARTVHHVLLVAVAAPLLAAAWPARCTRRGRALRGLDRSALGLAPARGLRPRSFQRRGLLGDAALRSFVPASVLARRARARRAPRPGGALLSRAATCRWRFSARC
jgi:hypothetical protein